MEPKSSCVEQETGDIGNVNLSCVKAALGIAVHVVAILTQCVGNS
jgi:hypothetical protein